MGCWNGTCGLTQLPIIHGEKIVLFPLIVNQYRRVGHGGFVYSNDQYKPISLQISGQYDDYGGIEEIENGEYVFEYFMNLLNKGELELDLERFHSWDEKVMPNDIKELMDYIERGKIKDVGYMIVLRSVYDKVMNDFKQRKYYKKEKTIYDNYIESTEKLLAIAGPMRENLKNMKAIASRFKTKGEELPEDFSEVYGDVIYSTGTFALRHNSKLINNPIIRFFETTSETAHYKMQWFLDKFIQTGDTQLKESIVDFAVFSVIMSFARKMWTPQVGAGSQSQETRVHVLLAEAVKEHIEHRHQQYLEWNEPDEDENPEDYKNGDAETLFYYGHDDDSDDVSNDIGYVSQEDIDAMLTKYGAQS